MTGVGQGGPRTSLRGVDVDGAAPPAWRTRLVAGAVVVLGLVALALWWPRLTAEVPDRAVVLPPPASETPAPTDEPTATGQPTPTATPTSSEPTGTPTPTPSPTLAPTETVLFRGGPATGPWQQLGTVAEITHPDAPPTARYSYDNFWSDPAEENQPAELWDQLVREVTAQLVQLGEPVNEPAFGGAPGSEPFNSFGGIEDISPNDRVFSATWSGVYATRGQIFRAYYWYLITFDHEVIHASDAPFIIAEAGGTTPEQNAMENATAMRAWMSALGYSCGDC
jgi:hypothetical protein